MAYAAAVLSELQNGALPLSVRGVLMDIANELRERGVIALRPCDVSHLSLNFYEALSWPRPAWHFLCSPGTRRAPPQYAQT